MIHHRAIQFHARAADLAADAPIPCTIATITPVMRMGVAEVLDCSPQGVDLSRAPLPLIITHDASQLAVGVIENLKATGDKVTGFARFATSPEAQQIRADVLGDVHRSLSAGYMHLDEGTPIEGGLMFRWQPFEVSIVPIPADPASGFFRSHPGVPHMNTNTNAATAVAAEIADLCHRHGIPDFSSNLIKRGLGVPEASAAILEELARRDFASGGHINISRAPAPAQATRAAIEDTLVARLGGRPTGEVLRNADVTSLAIRSLELTGQRVSDSEPRDRIFQRAMHTTSDFPLLLGNAVGRVLHQAFEQTPSAIKQIARLANLPDFRSKSVVRLGGAPSLEKVNESGEFTYGTVNEAAAGWRLATFGRIVSLSRQAMVNDDLSAFGQLLVKFGEAASRREAEELVSILLSPPSIDGSPLFHADRATLLTGAGSALQASSLGDAVQSLRSQKDIDGGLVMQEPATIIVPAALEMTARQLVASYTPAEAQSVQPFRLSVAVEPRLDAASKTAWYLVAANQNALEYGYLDGAQGIQTIQREGFEIDGMEIKARLDFGCGWVSPVGWVKSTGAES
ncbi:MAG: hypothetical protein PWQ61_2357 [Betaproteobacteria bacterium]|nr:hypothetical protein [Betaproteobacteria bacterium]